MIESQTWRRKGGLALWNYDLWSSFAGEESIRLLSNTKQRKNWLATRVCQAIYALKGFARAEEVSIWTLSSGEDTYLIDLCAKGALAKLEQILRCTNDITDVQFSLTLFVEAISPSNEVEQYEIDGGADLCFYIELNELGELDMSLDPPIWLTFSLDVDIYAPISWGQIRDNSQLAALNRLRLSKFLRRLEHDVPAKLMSIDADDYQGLIGSHGFFTAKMNSLSRHTTPTHKPPWVSQTVPNARTLINVQVV